MNPKECISVIVPAYNVAPYIVNCVGSILKQSYNLLEIILVDDGSTDGTSEILDKLAEQDSRIIVLHQENQGVTAARLNGVSTASGEWIGFVDGDDVVESDMYECLLRNAQRYNADISHCGYQMVFPDRIDYYYNTGQVIRQDPDTGLYDLLSGSFVEPGLCNKLFRRSLFDTSGLSQKMNYSIHNMEDLLMNFYLFKESRESIYEDFCPYHYLVRKDSTATSSINEHKLDDPLKVFHILADDVKRNKRLTTIVNRRLAGCLIGLSTMSLNPAPELIASRRKAARRELRRLMPELKKDRTAMKLYVQSCCACVFPSAYELIHRMVSHINGNGQKYKIQ